MNPVKGETGKYRLGIWVRDDLAGVGTLTYYRQDGSFGAPRTCGERRRHRRADEPVGRIYLRDENRQHPEGEERRPRRTCGDH